VEGGEEWRRNMEGGRKGMEREERREGGRVEEQERSVRSEG
jgi:hypothetical protein